MLIPVIRGKAEWFRWYSGTYLKSDYWRETRKKILHERGYRCEDCGATKRLQIHHLSYMFLGNEQPAFLKVLCYGCHEKVTKKDRRKRTAARVQRTVKRWARALF